MRNLMTKSQKLHLIHLLDFRLYSERNELEMPQADFDKLKAAGDTVNEVLVKYVAEMTPQLKDDVMREVKRSQVVTIDTEKQDMSKLKDVTLVETRYLDYIACEALKNCEDCKRQYKKCEL